MGRCCFFPGLSGLPLQYTSGLPRLNASFGLIEFAKKLTGKMQALKVGNGLDDGVNVGPLVNAEGRDKVIELVDDAVSKGAKVLVGGKAPGGTGYFYPATVLSNVPPNRKVFTVVFETTVVQVPTAV